MLKFFENVLNQQEQEYVIKKTIFGTGWSFLGSSNPHDGLINRLWFMNLIEDTFFTDLFFLRIRQIISDDVELLSVYANGQTHGICGKLHTDSNHEDSLTFLYYPANEWDIEWGGFTVFKINNEVLTKFPSPNSGVYFNSTIAHYGLEPSKHCPNLRVSIAFKLKKI